MTGKRGTLLLRGRDFRSAREQDLVLSITELAELSDVSVSYISRLERGLKAPSPRVRRKLAAALKVKPRDITFVLDVPCETAA